MNCLERAGAGTNYYHVGWPVFLAEYLNNYSFKQHFLEHTPIKNQPETWFRMEASQTDRIPCLKGPATARGRGCRGLHSWRAVQCAGARVWGRNHGEETLPGQETDLGNGAPAGAPGQSEATLCCWRTQRLRAGWASAVLTGSF